MKRIAIQHSRRCTYTIKSHWIKWLVKPQPVSFRLPHIAVPLAYPLA